jgi:hypothetical protein
MQRETRHASLERRMDCRTDKQTYRQICKRANGCTDNILLDNNSIINKKIKLTVYMTIINFEGRGLQFRLRDGQMRLHT